MAGPTSLAHSHTALLANRSHIAARWAYGRKLDTHLPAGGRTSLHSGSWCECTRRLPWIVSASVAGTRDACNGRSNGVYPRENEKALSSQHWQEKPASWVAHSAKPGPLKEATDFCDLPLNYYQILGIRESATQDEVWHAHQCALKASLVEEGYSDLAISAQKEILDAAYSVLSKDTQRREYTAHVRRGKNGVLSVPWEWLPGALILAQQAGEASLVLTCGQDALQRKALKAAKRDVLLAMALAQCSLARDDFEAATVSPACAHLKAALGLLEQGGDPPLRPDLQAEIRRTLEECGPAATLEQLAQPAHPGTLTARSIAVRQSLELVQAALTGAPQGDQLGSRVGGFLSSALESMGADEAVNGLPWEAISKAFRAGEIETGVMIRGAMAHCALGFRNREPKMIEQCGELLGLVVDREGERADVHAEMAVVALLLGLVDTALDWVGDVTPPPPGRVPVAGSVEEALRALNDESESGNRDAVMHNLCLFTERFLHTRVLAAFWDTRRSSPPLATYLEDKRVEQYWQSAAGGSPRTALLAYARATAEAIHTAVESAKWAVQHAQSKLRDVKRPPPRAVLPFATPPEGIASAPKPPKSDNATPQERIPSAPKPPKSYNATPQERIASAPKPPKSYNATPQERIASAPKPPKSEIDEVSVVERTAAALMSDRQYSAGVRPQLPSLDFDPAPPPRNEESIPETHEVSPLVSLPARPRRPKSRSPSPERPLLPPMEKRLEAHRQTARRQPRKNRNQSHRGGDFKGLAGGLLLAGVTLLVGIAGQKRLVHRAPETRPVSAARPCEKTPPLVFPAPRKGVTAPLVLPAPRKGVTAPLVVPAPREPLCDNPPPSPSKGVIPEGVRLPDAVPPATEWKRPVPPANVGVALPSMNSGDAEALVRKWHAAKADALGPLHALGGLTEVALPPLKTHWATIADEAKRGGRYWNYKLLDVAVDSAKVWRGEGGEEASLEVTIEEAAELVDTRDVSDNAVYYSTYRARYSLRRVDGEWKFCEGGKTR